MVTQSTDILARLVERVEGRYFGKYPRRGDQQRRPRQPRPGQGAVPRLFGDEDGLGAPRLPLRRQARAGLLRRAGRGVVDLGRVRGGLPLNPIWSGVWYGSGELPESASPAKKVLKTKSGHKLVLDDDGGSIEITDSNDNSVMMDSGTISIKAGSAVKIVVEAPQIELVETPPIPSSSATSLLQYLNQVVQLYQSARAPGANGAGAAGHAGAARAAPAAGHAVAAVEEGQDG